jgi:hypothetical protein
VGRHRQTALAQAQSGLKTLVLQDLDGDDSSNLYLSGKYQVSALDWNAVVRKLDAPADDSAGLRSPS